MIWNWNDFLFVEWYLTSGWSFVSTIFCGLKCCWATCSVHLTQEVIKCYWYVTLTISSVIRNPYVLIQFSTKYTKLSNILFLNATNRGVLASTYVHMIMTIHDLHNSEARIYLSCKFQIPSCCTFQAQHTHTHTHATINHTLLHTQHAHSWARYELLANCQNK